MTAESAPEATPICTLRQPNREGQHDHLRPGLLRALRADASMVTGGGAGLMTLARLLVTDQDYFSVALYRVRIALRRVHVPILPSILNRTSIALTGLNIDDHTVIQEGLHVPHGNIVLAGFTVIGKRTTIGPWTSIGTRAGSFSGPTFGDGVTIEAHVSVLGDLSIGDGALLTAGSVVTRDVPAGVTVAGVPAEPVSSPAERP